MASRRREIVPYVRPEHLGPVSEEMIIKALQASVGIQSDAARRLGISPQALGQRIKGSKRLQKVRDSIRYEYIDLSMSVILSELRQGSLDAAKFVMSKLGHLAGWVESHKLEIDPTGTGVLKVPGMMQSTEEWERMAIAYYEKRKEVDGDANRERRDSLQNGIGDPRTDEREGDL